MANTTKPPFHIRDEEDRFLIPAGQPGSYVDALAAAHRWASESSIVVEIVDRDIRIAVTITEVRHV